MVEKKMPWRIRFHLWRTGHVLVQYNPFIMVPLGAFDKGILATCKCGKGWAL